MSVWKTSSTCLRCAADVSTNLQPNLLANVCPSSGLTLRCPLCSRSILLPTRITGTLSAARTYLQQEKHQDPAPVLHITRWSAHDLCQLRSTKIIIVASLRITLSADRRLSRITIFVDSVVGIDRARTTLLLDCPAVTMYNVQGIN